MNRLSALCLLLLPLFVGCAHAQQRNTVAPVTLNLLTEEHPPVNFMQDGVISGLATEVVRELMHSTDTAGDIRLLPWEVGYKTALEQPNTALFATTMTPARKGLFQWVGPIGVMDTNFYALRGSGLRIAALEDAKGVRQIAAVTDYYSEQVLKQEGFTNLKSYSDETTAAKSLLTGESQLYISSNTTFPAVLQKLGASMSQVENAFTVSTDLTYIAFSRATAPQLVAQWQMQLDRMKQSGRFNAISRKWLPHDSAPGVVQMVTEDYPPVTFAQDGAVTGLATDIVREIARRNAIPDNIRLTSWKNAYHMALLHPNVVLFSAERTPEREALFNWIGPVGRNNAMLFARKGSGIKIASLEEARQVRAIATTTDWFTEQHLKRAAFTNLVSSKDPADNVHQLMSGAVQLSVFTDLTAPAIVTKAGYSMNDLEPVYTISQTDFYIAISKGTPDAFVQQWQRSLEAMKQDGTFEKIYRRYLPHADLAGLVDSR